METHLQVVILRSKFVRLATSTFSNYYRSPFAWINQEKWVRSKYMLTSGIVHGSESE